MLKVGYIRSMSDFKKLMKNIINKNMEMVSLYDYLGRAAGSELGKQVATAAAKAGVKHEIREVSNINIQDLLCYILDLF